MFVTAMLRDDNTIAVTQVFGPSQTRDAAVAKGKAQSGCDDATEDEYGRYTDDDGLAQFSVHRLIAAKQLKSAAVGGMALGRRESPWARAAVRHRRPAGLSSQTLLRRNTRMNPLVSVAATPEAVRVAAGSGLAPLPRGDFYPSLGTCYRNQAAAENEARRRRSRTGKPYFVVEKHDMLYVLPASAVNTESEHAPEVVYRAI